MTRLAGPTPGPGEPLESPMGAGCPSSTCQVHQALQAGGQVALGALGVPEVEGLQGCHRWELPADHRESVRAGGGTWPCPGTVGSSLGNGASPELRMQEGVVVEDEGLQVDQASQLRREALQLVVAQVEVEQIRQVDEELVGDGVDAAGRWASSGLPGTCTSPGSPSKRGREQDPERSGGTDGGGRGPDPPVMAKVEDQHVLGILQFPGTLRELVVAQVLGQTGEGSRHHPLPHTQQPPPKPEEHLWALIYSLHLSPGLSSAPKGHEGPLRRRSGL